MATTDSSDVLRLVLVVIAVLLLAPLLMMVFAVPMMGLLGGGPFVGMRNGVMPLWGLGMLLVPIAVLVGVGYVLYRGLAGGSDAGTDPAMEELRLAYARGDLSEEEFEERRRTLRRQE